MPTAAVTTSPLVWRPLPSLTRSFVRLMVDQRPTLPTHLSARLMCGHILPDRMPARNRKTTPVTSPVTAPTHCLGMPIVMSIGYLSRACLPRRRRAFGHLPCRSTARAPMIPMVLWPLTRLLSVTALPLSPNRRQQSSIPTVTLATTSLR